MTEARPVQILLVEDNPGDVLLTREALREGKVLNHLSIVGDGEAASAYLRRQGPYSDALRPDLILLDLNLPRKDGREVLAEIKSDPELRRIPVVVLTPSKAEKDVLAAYDRHANSYMVKPVDLAQFMAMVRAIEHFWLTLVTLPPK